MCHALVTLSKTYVHGACSIMCRRTMIDPNHTIEDDIADKDDDYVKARNSPVAWDYDMDGGK